MGSLHKEKKPTEWERVEGETGELHVGAERGLICENMQALVTDLLQRHWEWQEVRQTDVESGFFRCRTAFVASLDVMTAFDVAKPAVMSKVLSFKDVASLAEMQDVQGLPRFRVYCTWHFRWKMLCKFDYNTTN